MNYILADKDKAVSAGFSALTHNTFKGRMILTEKEVLRSPLLVGTEDGRLAALDGQVVTHDMLRSGVGELYNEEDNNE